MTNSKAEVSTGRKRHGNNGGIREAFIKDRCHRVEWGGGVEAGKKKKKKILGQENMSSKNISDSKGK